MSEWTADELVQANREDLYISIPNEDGSLHAPTWIWMVEVDGQLYARSYNGSQGRWYTAAKRAGHGRAAFGTVDRAVTFTFPSDAALDAQIDEAYKIKYAGSPYLEGPLHEPMRSTTVKLIPSSD